MTTDTSFAFSVGPDERAARAAVKHFLRPSFTLLRGAGLAMFLVGLFLLFWEQYLVALLIILLGLGFALVVPSRTLQRVMKRVGPMVGLGSAYRIDGQGIFAANELAEVLYRWPALTRVDELPGILLVAVGESGFVSIRTGELDPPTRAELTGFVRERVGRR
jgi:hypothetical protein